MKFSQDYESVFIFTAFRQTMVKYAFLYTNLTLIKPRPKSVFEEMDFINWNADRWKTNIDLILKSGNLKFSQRISTME